MRRLPSRSMAPAVLLLAIAMLPASEARAAPRVTLTDASPSIDDLVARFLDTLRRKDADGLRALRCTKSEYIGLILSGSVPDGAPLREWSEEVNDFYWSLLHTKSVYSEANILSTFGGGRYTRVAINYSKGTQKYATYTAYKQLELTVRDENGVEREIRIGSIAEVNGRYKFISFIRD
jgi:hypothetical protein